MGTELLQKFELAAYLHPLLTNVWRLVCTCFLLSARHSYLDKNTVLVMAIPGSEHEAPAVKGVFISTYMAARI
jgi:hypothetical protein